jgi:hypothetical protein
MTTQLQHAIVRVRKHDGEPVGAGLLVADRLVLTCAHVINQALGLADDSQAQPHETVCLDFPFLPTEPYLAQVVRWIPVAHDGSGDIAGLALSAAPPSGAAPIQLVAQADLWDTDFRVQGFPAGYDDGIYSHGRIRGYLANGYVQLEAEGELKTLPGFSGSPVWSEQANGVVGIIVAADRNPKIKLGFMIPTTALAAAWDVLQSRAQWPVPKADFLPTVGGAVAPTSPFYITREADAQAARLIKQGGVTLAIRGARQIGKSSLLASIIAQASEAGKQVGYINFQSSFDMEDFADAGAFYKLFFATLSEELALDDRTDENNAWNAKRANNQNGTRYLTQYLLRQMHQPLVLALDEVDRLYQADFCSDFFAMLRGWHNDRASRPALKDLDIVLVASTEVNAFIKDPHQSPFNVATSLYLRDFDATQVSRLNTLHNNCLGPDALQELHALLNGHPYLIRQALYCVATAQHDTESLFACALRTDETGPFADHLRHYESILDERDDLWQGFKQVLYHQTRPHTPVHYALIALGLTRETAQGAVPRNALYTRFFTARLNR